ncbi:MAG TPA: ferredoxin [Candidatus Krumholzibacteria bacterium]|nr:ferredoxin [Candidatus Krumholzibacteria bacterium]
MARVERGEDAGLTGAAPTNGPAPDAAEGTFWTPSTETGQPVEPEAAPENKPADANRILDELRAFYGLGKRPANTGNSDGAAPLPALLHAYRDLARVRHTYPLLLNADNPTAAVRPLTAVIDELLANVAGDDDEGRQLRHNVLRLEAIMRSMLDGRDGERLSLVWDRAAATLFETSRLTGDKATALRDNIAAARKALVADGELVACGPNTGARIFQTCAAASWRACCESWSTELDGLIRQLQDVLSADFSRSDAAMTPEHLGKTLGTDSDLDVEAMSSLVRSAPHGGGLSDARRERVLGLIATLTALQPLFATGTPGSTPIQPTQVWDDFAAASEEHARRMRAMVAFFRSARIARLETRNQYREAAHDAYFASFGERNLTADELALCPPVLVRVTDDALSGDGAARLFEILGGRAAIKVLLEVRSPYRVGEDGLQPALSINWAGRLAGMATSLNNAYVTQVPLSRADVLSARIAGGLRYAGPALFCVGAPSHVGRGIAPHLAAAATAEARFTPLINFDPSRGDTLADCFDLSDNPQNERTWPVETFAYRGADDKEATRELAFTPADLLFLDDRTAGHFWSVPASHWHVAMAPLADMLAMPAAEAAGKIPFILTVDRDNRIGRAVVSHGVTELSRQCRTCWHALRESCGIESSFARRAVTAERERLAQEKEREIEAIEKDYVAQLEQDVGELTREIVQRIAGQLLGAEVGGVVTMPTMPASAPRGDTTAAPTEAPAVSSPEPEEEEKVSFDDPYIDTPLCTSCNECTQLNNRVFGYNSNKQAEIKDATAGPYSDIVRAAELCPVHIIHPGKPANPGEPGVEEWVKRAAQYN